MGLHARIQSGQPILVGEISPPTGADPAPLRRTAGRYAGKVHALSVSDNRERVCMSAMVAASLVAAEGVEPILNVVTRDRNRTALVSDYLGARALGIENLLCTTGTHQTLGRFRAARNVFDLDSIQLLKTYANLASDGQVVGEAGIDGCEPACLGGTAAPFADPVPLQVLRLAKKVAAGAEFLITQPVFDLDRFEAWWEAVRQEGLDEKVAILAGVRVFTDAEQAKEYAQRRPSPLVPDAVLAAIAAKADRAAQRAAGIEIACETIRGLSAAEGLRGFEICGGGDDEAVLEVIEKSGLEAGTD